MMLSKVAERVYWTARYLERIESTARLISIYDKLLFDLPRDVELSWYNLIIVNGTEVDFNARYTVRDERNVVKFMLGDTTNSGSLVSSLAAIRENIRTTRDVVLEETWELANELNMFVQENLQLGINRSKRYNFLDTVIKGCQQILGLLYGNMPHDAAWDFLRLGRNIERADMTSRNLEAGAAALAELKHDEHVINARQIIWGNVLRSLNAEMSYRRYMHCTVSGNAVVEYLLNNEELPRSLAHCLNAIVDSSSRLPNSTSLLAKLEKTKSKLDVKFKDDALGEPFRKYLNEMQIELSECHQNISELWFPKIV